MIQRVPEDAMAFLKLVSHRGMHNTGHRAKTKAST
jgi:hypothetical protein